MKRSLQASNPVAPERSTLGPILVDESAIKFKVPPVAQAQAALDAHKATRPAMGDYETFQAWNAAMDPWLREKDRLTTLVELAQGRERVIWKPVDPAVAQAEREARQASTTRPKYSPEVPPVPEVSNPPGGAMPRLKAADPQARAAQILSDLTKAQAQANGPDADEAKRASARWYERRATLTKHCKAHKIPMPEVPPLHPAKGEAPAPRVNKPLTSAPQDAPPQQMQEAGVLPETSPLRRSKGWRIPRPDTEEKPWGTPLDGIALARELLRKLAEEAEELDPQGQEAMAWEFHRMHALAQGFSLSLQPMPRRFDARATA